MTILVTIRTKLAYFILDGVKKNVSIFIMYLMVLPPEIAGINSKNILKLTRGSKSFFINNDRWRLTHKIAIEISRKL